MSNEVPNDAPNSDKPRWVQQVESLQVHIPLPIRLRENQRYGLLKGLVFGLLYSISDPTIKERVKQTLQKIAENEREDRESFNTSLGDGT